MQGQVYAHVRPQPSSSFAIYDKESACVVYSNVKTSESTSESLPKGIILIVVIHDAHISMHTHVHTHARERERERDQF